VVVSVLILGLAAWFSPASFSRLPESKQANVVLVGTSGVMSYGRDQEDVLMAWFILGKALGIISKARGDPAGKVLGLCGQSCLGRCRSSFEGAL